MDKIEDDVVEASISAWCKNHNNKKHEDFIRAAIRAAVLAEREACAKVVEQIFDDLAKDNFVDSTAVANLICNFGDFVGKPLIEAIRARGEQ